MRSFILSTTPSLISLTFRTEIELVTSIQSRAHHPLDGSSTPSELVKDAARKSIEMVESAPPSPSAEPPPTAAPALTPAIRRKARIQFAVCCFTLFLAGWNDGTTGPLLPRMQVVYHACKFLATDRTRANHDHLTFRSTSPSSPSSSFLIASYAVHRGVPSSHYISDVALGLRVWRGNERLAHRPTRVRQGECLGCFSEVYPVTDAALGDGHRCVS